MSQQVLSLLFSEALDQAQETTRRSVHTPIRALSLPIPCCGSGFKMVTLLAGLYLPKFIADPHPVSLLATSEKYHKHHTPILLLVSRNTRRQKRRKSSLNCQARQPAHFAAFVCHAFTRSRLRYPHIAETSRTRRCANDANLHARYQWWRSRREKSA